MLKNTAKLAKAIVPDVHHILFYEYVHDVMERRAPFRAAHLEHVAKFGNAVRMGGALDPASEGAIIVFKADVETVNEFAKNDPYVKGGIVASYKVRPWNVVVDNSKM